MESKAVLFPRSFFLLALIALATLIPGVVVGQVNYRVIAFTGDPVEVSRTTARLGSFTDPAINDSNQVAYRALVYGRGVTNADNEAVVRQRLFRRTSAVLAAKGGQILNGYLSPGSRSSEVSPDPTTSGENTTVTKTYVRVDSGVFSGSDTASPIFGNRVAINESGNVVFSAVSTIGSSNVVDTTVTNNTTGEATSTSTATAAPSSSPRSLFVSNGSVNLAVLSEGVTFGPTLSTFTSFGSFANGQVALTGTAPNATGQFMTNIGPVLADQRAEIRPIVLNGDIIPGLPINQSPPFGETNAGINITSTVMPGVNLGGISSVFITTDASTINPGSRFNGIWNFAGNPLSDESVRPGFFLGVASPVLDANRDIVGLFSGFGGSNPGDGLPLTVAASSRGFIAFNGVVILDAGQTQPGIFFSRVAPDGFNFGANVRNVAPGQFANPAAPSQDDRLPYVSNGFANISILAGANAPVNNAFPNPERSAPAQFAFFGQPGINNRGTIVFEAGLTTLQQGLWAIPFGARQPGNRVAVCIALEGDIITVNRVPRKVVAIRFNPANGLNNFNRVVYTVSFDDSTSAVMFANIQQNTGYIE